MDTISLNRIQNLHPAVKDEVLAIYSQQIVPALKGRAICRVTSTYRSFDEQARIYAQGRTELFDPRGNRLGIVTKAKPGTSYHNYGLALDFCLIIDGKTASWDWKTDYDGDGVSDWMEVVNAFKTKGWEWGGDWKFVDRPHFQKTFGYKTADLLKKRNARDFIKGTQWVNL